MSVLVDGKKYHIAITHNGTTYGFMIVKGSDTRQRVNDWAPIYSTGDQQFAEGTWQPWALTDFSGGLSQERYDNGAQSKFYSAKNCETRLPGRATLGGTWVSGDAGQNASARPLDFANSVVLVPCGTLLRKYPVGTGPWSTGYTAAANILHAHVDGPFLYLALGASNDAVKLDANLAVVSLPGNPRANCWASYGAKIWRALTNHIYGSADSGATWPTDVAVGDASSNIQFMLPYNQKLYVGKDDSLWSYDGTNVVKVLDFSNQSYVGNFKFMTEWGGSLYFNILRRVIRFTTTSWSDITPLYTGDADKENFGFGVPMMMCNLPSMLMVAFQNGEGDQANVLGYTGSAWHQIYGPTTSTLYAVGYSRYKDWILVNDGATRFQAQIAQADRCTANYEASGQVVTPWFDGGYPFFKKSGKSITCETRDCSAEELIRIHYQTTDGGSWTPLASDIVSSTGPTTISLDAVAGAIEFYKIRFMLEFHRGPVVSKRPVLTAFILHYLNRPESVFAYSVTVKLSSRVRTLAG